MNNDSHYAKMCEQMGVLEAFAAGDRVFGTQLSWETICWELQRMRTSCTHRWWEEYFQDLDRRGGQLTVNIGRAVTVITTWRFFL